MTNTAKTFISKCLRTAGFLFLVSLTTGFSAKAQDFNLPLHHNFRIKVDTYIGQSKAVVNTGFKPVLSSQFQKTGINDSVLWQQKSVFFKEKPQNLILRKLFFENFIDVQTEDFTLVANPLFFLRAKKDNEKSEFYTVNTRGLELKGRLGKKMAYYTSFRENQAFFASHIDSFVSRRLIVPGQGAHKTFRDSGYDYSSAEAYISYSPSDFLNLQIGHGKHFVGEGYRSLLLSDNAFNYPFLKLTLFHSGWQYQQLYAQFEDFEDVYYNYHRRKHASINYLSYNYKNIIEVGMFEGIIYQSLDTTDYSYHLPWDFYPPLPFIKSLSNSNKLEHYLLGGFNIMLRPVNLLKLYAQAAFSPAHSGTAFQAGIKLNDAFFNKLSSHALFLQAEYNSAQNRLYAHPDEGLQSRSHYNQELAHPAGSNFSELLFRIQYRFNRLTVSAKYIKINRERTAGQILIPDSNLAENPNPTVDNITYNTIEAAYTLNPAWQLQLFAGTEIRQYNAQKNNFFYFGLKTALSNFQTDFI